ncbi:hypothetical protein OUZ56_018903 [Daphnia magna]|uniref:Uncharacterized protein n=1 Tax=Daphnia magna TaxID=35525 RepID=A0ABQ9ZA28_9CRUS|nr:hypothetical protein OUZ56_018903 [Daphnia magna]
MVGRWKELNECSLGEANVPNLARQQSNRSSRQLVACIRSVTFVHSPREACGYPGTLRLFSVVLST